MLLLSGAAAVAGLSSRWRWRGGRGCALAKAAGSTPSGRRPPGWPPLFSPGAAFSNANRPPRAGRRPHSGVGGAARGHISVRTRGAGDDPRYAELAREWGADFPRRLFVFLQIQAAAALPLVAAVALAARAPRPFPDLFDLAAIVVAAAALAGEAMADAQLAKFRREGPSGGLCEIGLWRFSRHPNYFFEFLFWCAWPLLAFDLSGDYPQGLLALAAPAFIYWLLAHVSGVPLLEKQCAPRAARRSRITPAASTPSFRAPGAIEQAWKVASAPQWGARRRRARRTSNVISTPRRPSSAMTCSGDR